MNSPRGERRGRQSPRLLTRPPFKSEAAGLEAIELAESVGLVLDPWQRLLTRVTLAEAADGRWAADTVAALVARQNGKGGWLEAVALHGMFLVRDPLTLWTAHQFKTSSEAFLRIRGWIDGSDDLRKCVSRMNAAHGEEGIELYSGSVRLRFVARSKSSGRGFSPQRIIFDEAQELSSAAQGALVPSMRAQRNRQSIYTGTVPSPDVNHPEVFTGLRDRGRQGVAKRFAWAEWSPKGSDDPVAAAALDLDDAKHWAGSNPALGYRVTLDALQSDRNELTDDDFSREALSVWPSSSDEGIGVFGAGVWDSLKADVPPQRPDAIGLEVAADRATASIGAAVAGDVATVAAISEQPGTGWLVPEAKRIQAEYGCRVAIHGSGPASDLIPALEAAGVKLMILKAGDYADACAGIWDRVMEGRLRHPDHDPLNQAERGATKRHYPGDRWVWDLKKAATNSAMLKAATVALWAASKAPPTYDVLDSIY